MSNRPRVPNWNNINLNKPEEYSSEFTVDGLRYANVTNVSTGQRQLYLVSGFAGTPFTQRNLITSTTANGKVERGGAYDDYVRRYGQGKLNNAEINNKRQSNFIIPKAATPQELQSLKQSPQYKSAVGNTAPAGGGTNAGITTTGGDQQGGNPGGGDPSSPPDDDSSTSQPIVDLTKLEKINPGYVRTTYGDPMRYPLTMNTDKDIVKQDVIKFSMFEYNPAYKFSQGEEGSSFAKSSQKKSLRGTVILPIQPTIVDSNSVNWQEDSIDPLVLAAIDASTGFIEGEAGGLEKAISGIIKKLGAEGNDNLGNALKAAAVSMATGKNIFTRTTGAILNPNMELLFNGPSLRQFSYSFNLSARSAPESRAIQRIIRFFKQGMSVQRSAGELFLVTPDIFEIEYLLKEGKDNHPYINRIKTCALTNCSVDYTPTGSYMTFNDGAMVSYTLSLSFEELEPIYHDDYEPLGEDVIGY
jgi:hypothetical protein